MINQVGFNWRKAKGTLLLLTVIALAYSLELKWSAPGNDAALLKLGALPDSGGLHGQYWRLLTFGFLHFSNLHILENTLCLFLGGSIVEHRVGSPITISLFVVSSILSGAAIVLKHWVMPGAGSSVGASGGMFATLGAAMVLVQRVPPSHLTIRLLLWSVIVAGFAISFLPNVSMVGHLAGFAVGIVVGFVAPIERSNLQRAFDA